MDYSKIIRDIPDFPKKGIVFKDITTVWKDPEAMKASIDDLAAHIKGKKIDKIVAPESRGFIIGAPLAYLCGAGFVPARKPGKLPAETVSQSYTLEYGEAVIEIHKDAISRGDRVIIADDLLATGGTTRAIISLVEKLGGRVEECLFIVELDFLKGRDLFNYPVHSLVRF